MTKEIGNRLTNSVAVVHPDVTVFYDHGRSGDHNVCQPTTYMGRRYGADATLSGVDIVAVKDRKVIVVVEIEEGGFRPKTMLGDVFGVALADSMHIQGDRYVIEDAVIVIAVVHDGKGKKGEKCGRLERHLARYFLRQPSRSVSTIRVLPCSSEDIVRRIERLVRLELSKRKRRETSSSRTPPRTLRRVPRRK